MFCHVVCSQFAKLSTYKKLWKKLEKTLDAGYEALHIENDPHMKHMFEDPYYVFMTGALPVYEPIQGLAKG